MAFECTRVHVLFSLDPEEKERLFAVQNMKKDNDIRCTAPGTRLQRTLIDNVTFEFQRTALDGGIRLLSRDISKDSGDGQ